MKHKETPFQRASCGHVLQVGDNGSCHVGEHGTAIAGKNSLATAANNGHAVSGDYGTAIVERFGIASAGNKGMAIAGDCASATAGDHGIATAGNYSTATVGYLGTATAGKKGIATAGDWGTAIVGLDGVASAGKNGKIHIQYFDSEAIRYRTAVGYIGEGGLEPGVPYQLDENNEFVKGDNAVTKFSTEGHVTILFRGLGVGLINVQVVRVTKGIGHPKPFFHIEGSEDKGYRLLHNGSEWIDQVFEAKKAVLFIESLYPPVTPDKETVKLTVPEDQQILVKVRRVNKLALDAVVFHIDTLGGAYQVSYTDQLTSDLNQLTHVELVAI